MSGPLISNVAVSTPFEPSRNPDANGLNSQLNTTNAQDAIEESQPMIQQAGVDVNKVGKLNFIGNVTVTNTGDYKVTVNVGTSSDSVFENTMYWANCVCHCDGQMFSDFEALVDYTYNGIAVGDC